MTIREFYEQIGENYDDVLARLLSESLIKKVLILFENDFNYTNLLSGIKSQNAELAFISIHTIKGTSYNIGLNKLGDKASTLTEILRDRVFKEGYKEAFDVFNEEYEKVIKTLEKVNFN